MLCPSKSAETKEALCTLTITVQGSSRGGKEEAPEEQHESDEDLMLLRRTASLYDIHGDQRSFLVKGGQQVEPKT